MKKYILLCGLLFLSFSVHANNKEYWREKIIQKQQEQTLQRKDIQAHKKNKTNWHKNRQQTHKNIFLKKSALRNKTYQ